MKANKPTIPAGYRVATKEERQKKFGGKSMNGIILLKLNEVLTTGDCIVKDIEIKHKDGSTEVVQTYKMNCTSSIGKDRVIPLSYFNPYPVERTELMSQSRFFQDVAEFPGDVPDFIDWLEELERPLVIKSQQRMEYTPFGEQNTKTKVFYVIEYGDLV